MSEPTSATDLRMLLVSFVRCSVSDCQNANNKIELLKPQSTYGIVVFPCIPGGLLRAGIAHRQMASVIRSEVGRLYFQKVAQSLRAICLAET